MHHDQSRSDQVLESHSFDVLTSGRNKNAMNIHGRGM